MKYIILCTILFLLQFFIDSEIYAFGSKSPENQNTETASETIPNKKTNQNARCICPMIYMPVCGEDKKTYSNSCQANCANVTVATLGECTKNNE